MYNFGDKRLLMLKPSDIEVEKERVRKSFDEYELVRLADSIRSGGIIQPVSVRKKTEGGYFLIAGERRLRAAVMAGVRRVPCILHTADSETATIISLTENMQRSNLTVFEEAEGINRLISVFKLSRAEAAIRLGIAQSTLSNKLRLLSLNETIRERIIKAGLTERHARELLRLPDGFRETALDKIIAEGFTISETEKYISSVLKPEVKPEPDEPVRKAAIGDVRLFSNSLSKLLSTLNNAGIEARSRKYETDKYIEYKVRINKITPDNEKYKQMKIC